MTESTRLSPRALTLLLGSALAITLVIGVIGGLRLGAWASRPAASELRLVSPESLPGATERGLPSRGGFTGFGGPPALQGDVLQQGTVAESQTGAFALVENATRTDVDLTGSQRLYRIEAANRPLQSGDQVVVRVDGTRALAILRAETEGTTAPR